MLYATVLLTFIYCVIVTHVTLLYLIYVMLEMLVSYPIVLQTLKLLHFKG